MSDMAMETARLLNMLPESEQSLALEVVKRLVRSWDPDFTKLTAEEAEQLAAAEASGFVDDGEIDWSQIGRRRKNGWRGSQVKVFPAGLFSLHTVERFGKTHISSAITAPSAGSGAVGLEDPVEVCHAAVIGHAAVPEDGVKRPAPGDLRDRLVRHVLVRAVIR